jgi:hypothetical protein
MAMKSLKGVCIVLGELVVGLWCVVVFAAWVRNDNVGFRLDLL